MLTMKDVESIPLAPFPFLDFAIAKKPRVLVFGSRNWPAHTVIGFDMANLKKAIGDYTLVHGAAAGADTFADDYAQYLRLEIDPFKADWVTHAKAAGPIRNQKMLDSGLDYAMGYVFNDSKGSADMAGRLRKAGVPMRIANLHFNHTEGFPVI